MKSIFDINGYIADKLGFSYGLWLLVGAVVFAVLCLDFILSVRRGRVKGRQAFIETGWTALAYFGLVALSLLLYWPFGDKVPLVATRMPALVWCVSAAVVACVCIWMFLRRKKRFADKVSATAIRRSAAGSGASKYCFALIFGGMLVASVICLVRAIGGDSIYHLVVPMAIVVVTLLLHYLTRLRLWFFLGALAVLAYAFFFMQNVLSATEFRYTPLVAMIPLYLSAVLPMFTLSFIDTK